jgi:iron complex outermembrane receptor protein
MKVRSLSTSLTLLSLAISTQLYAQTVETDASVQTTAAVKVKTNTTCTYCSDSIAFSTKYC